MSKNWKFLVGTLLAVGAFTLAFFLASCGERQETSNYHYNPSWTRGGSIVFTTGLRSIRKDAIGTQLGSSYAESVTTCDATGAGDTFYFDVTGAPPYSASCSPVFDYVAYLDDLRSNLFHRIVVRNVAAGAHSGFDKIELAFNPGIKSFDWSADGAKLVYCTTREVRTINVGGTGDSLVTAESNLNFVAWKYGGRIAFVHGSLLSLIYADGSGRIDLAAAASVDRPQISATNTSEVFGLAGGSYCKVDVSVATPATSEILAGCSGDLPRLNATANKVIYSKIDSGEQSGIYALDLTAKTEAKIK